MPPNLKEKAAKYAWKYALRINSLAIANGFANEMAKMSSSLQKVLVKGRLRQNSLAIANAMAWCTQVPSKVPSKRFQLEETKIAQNDSQLLVSGVEN